MILVVKDILAGIFNPNQLLSQLRRIQSESKEILRQALKSDLEESGLRFQCLRAGHDQHQPTKHLTPWWGTLFFIKTVMTKSVMDRSQKFSPKTEWLSKLNCTKSLYAFQCTLGSLSYFSEDLSRSTIYQLKLPLTTQIMRKSLKLKIWLNQWH